MCTFNLYCEITFLVGGPGKSNVVLGLEKSLEMVAMFCMNPIFKDVVIIML